MKTYQALGKLTLLVPNNFVMMHVLYVLSLTPKTFAVHVQEVLPSVYGCISPQTIHSYAGIGQCHRTKKHLLII